MKIKLLFVLFVTALLFNCESDKPKKDAVNVSQEMNYPEAEPSRYQIGISFLFRRRASGN